MKKILLLLAAALAVLSCNSIKENDFADLEAGFALVQDNGQDTKSFLDDDGSNWSFIWENGDELNYIVTNGSSVRTSGVGMLRNTHNGTNLDLDASFKSRDIFYVWYAPGKAGADPSSVALSIPAYQISDYTRESFTEDANIDLSIVSPKLDKTSVSSSSSTSNSSKAPETRTLSFTISNYKPGTKYYCKTGSNSAVALSPSSAGACSVSVKFSNIAFGTSKSGTSSGSLSTTFKVYASGKESSAATLKINVTGTKTATKSGGFFGWGAKTTYTYAFTYSVDDVVSGAQTGRVTTEGELRATPLHDAMPIVCSPVSVTNDMLSHSSPVKSLKYTMLAAGIEWQIYTTNTAVGPGEKIESVSFTSAGQAIAGDFTYNLKTNPLTISGLDEQTVVSYVSDLGYTVGNSASDYASIYSVIAPGAFAGQMVVTTDKANYYATLKENTYQRGYLKRFTIDLNLSAVTRVPLGEEYPEAPQEPEPLTFFISSNFTNCAFEGTPAESVTEGESFTATIVPDEGCEMGEVSVSMGGTAMTGAWDAATGVVSIARVTGDVEITAEAASISVPEEPEPEVEHMESWSFFTSDRHGDTNAVPGILNYIKNNVTTTLDYACLIGDMVGSTGGDAPAFKTSTIKAEVTGAFPNADVLISYGSHDAGATDDAGILNRTSCRGYTITYAGSEEVAYYVYSIPHDFMENSSSAQTAAPQFVSWASTLDPSKPIVVVSHVPTVAKRGDNGGAMYWHNAMNQVATGSASGTTITRNLIFFCAHNHTTDQTELYYAPLETMKVASKTSDKLGTSCKIYYTYSVAGYIKTSKSGTLMKITNDTIEISLAKYKSTGLVSGSSHTIQRVGLN